MQDKEILDVITSNPNEEYRIIDESGRCFWGEVDEVSREQPTSDYTVISARMEPTDGLDSTAFLVGHPLPDESWMVNIHYFSSRLPTTERVERVEPSTGDS